MFGQANFWIYYGYCALGIIITGVYIIVDLVYIMVPGALDLDDYILGALMLYLDIMRMFVYILEILGSRK